MVRCKKCGFPINKAGCMCGPIPCYLASNVTQPQTDQQDDKWNVYTVLGLVVFCLGIFMILWLVVA